MLTLIHNPHCSKSRAALALTEAAAARLGETLHVIEYLRTPLSLEALQTLRDQLAVPARTLLREGETVYAELGLDNPALGDDQLLAAIATHPALLQRPILVRDGRAVIARPPELALTLLD